MKTIQEIIDYLEQTTPESWCQDVIRTNDGRNCFFGHLFNLGGNKLWDWFENIATNFMIYPVNDGTDERYQQPTAKERCIAYLKDLRDGKAKTTYQLMDEYDSSDHQQNDHII